ncbi:MAG: outer membrane protein assembly factor BamB [Rhizobacter sp.]|nr:outer membrane protein assembly factor BamB [Burkholderiaceae bacterium]MCO5123958.1 outer membrane protein assembly factor BamB [Rhizobacter sp.]
MNSWRRAAGWLALAFAATLVACSGTPKPKPTPLEPLTPQIGGRQVWSQRIGKVEFDLQVAVNNTASSGGVFTVASSDGTVIALQADSGSELWRANVDGQISAGVGSDGRYAAVVTRSNELVVIDAGRVIWRVRLGARVATAPLVAGERVFVMSVDRVVAAFDVLDGRSLWVLRRPSDPLTLAKAGVLASFKDTLLAGQGPKLAGVDPLHGTMRWEVAVATPRGANEVERLSDLLAPISRVGNVVCARAFQNAVGCVNADRGTIVWTRNVGGNQGIAGDGQVVVGADGSDRITAWNATTGDVVWTNDKLLYRELSAPLLVGRTAVFGDLEGNLHFLAREDGSPLLRLTTDASAITTAPALSDKTMLVVTRSGGLFAFRPE